MAAAIFLLVALAAFLLPQMCSSRETARGNTCRNNMRGLATALFNYQVRAGTYPGYMNALKLNDGKPYVNPQTGAVTPVSWVVMILPDIDRAPLFDQWTMPTENVRGNDFIQTHVYIDQLFCPSDPQASKISTPISFVVNTGLPDAPAARIDKHDPTRNTPRDWAANGMFFDNYSEHPLMQRDDRRRGPMVLMNDNRVRDPKARTILLTENVDATNYTFDAAKQGADGWRAAEIETGCIWQPGTFEVLRELPKMNLSVPSLYLNVDLGKGDGKSFHFTRPSSHHPESVNVAFVEVNVTPLNERVSYFVYAKLMTSDDAMIAPAGVFPEESVLKTIDPDRHLRDYKLKEEDIWP